MINLLPPEHREYIIYGRRNAQLLNWLYALVFGILVLALVALVGRLTIQTAKNQALEQKNSISMMLSDQSLVSTEDEYSDYVSGMTAVNKLYQRQILYSRLLRKMATLLPPGASLTNISLAEKDRAINLDFTSSVDGLGPTIHINLLNQGEQIAEQTRVQLEGFGIQLAGESEILANGTSRPLITIDKDTKKLEFLIAAPKINNKDPESLNKLSAALSNGGNFSFEIVKDSLIREGYAVSYNYENKTFQTSSSDKPQVFAYTVNTDAKYVDYSVGANDLTAAKRIADTLMTTARTTYIETYTFENNEYNRRDDCRLGSEETCRMVCRSTTQKNCTESEKKCVPLSQNGCRYTVRAYYDELFTSATITPASQEESADCKKNSIWAGGICTHKINASYNQLFERVDINRVASCAPDPINIGALSCPVQMRAEFGSNAKFYLISSGAAQ